MEDRDVTNERDGGAQSSVEHVPAEVQLRNECENLWLELNNVGVIAQCVLIKADLDGTAVGCDML